MSLLLKALKQAESIQPEAVRTPYQEDLKIETPDDSPRERDWVEPPGLLFGSGGLEGKHQRRGIRWPHLSLVPAVLLLATLIALGYGAWLYFALQPSTVLPTPTPAAAAQAIPQPPPAVSRTATPSGPEAISPKPEAATPPAPAAPPRAQPPVHAATAARPAPAATGAATARPGTSAPPQFQPDAQAALLGQAYAAYQREDLAEAQRLYAQAQTRQPGADALLGLATIATLQNREAEAQRLYREVLALDPRNATAQAALLDLLGSADGTAAESRLKTLIDREPTPQLYQTLAGVYAAQGRWREAQAAYFESWRGAPDNADYAYNLAVSLDELREHAAALTYYEKALATAGAHRFDRDQAAARVLQLKRAR